jgi:hypothetical protein
MSEKSEKLQRLLDLFLAGAGVFIYTLRWQLMAGARQLKIGGFVYDSGVSLQH